MKKVGDVIGCRHGSAALRRKFAASGAITLGYFCDECRRWVSKEKGYRGTWIALDDPRLDGVNVDAVPLLEDYLLYRQCEWCGEAGLCEAHHSAPRKIFGDAAETFPLIYLCRPCHERWHEALTPGLCTAYDAAAHARQLAQWLSRDDLRRLAIALHRLMPDAA